MKKRITAFILSAALVCGAAVPAFAQDDDGSDNSAQKAVASQQENPETGAVTLGTVSVALAGCAVLVCKKRK